MATNSRIIIVSIVILLFCAAAKSQFLNEHRKDYLNLADAFSQLKHDYQSHFLVNHINNDNNYVETEVGGNGYYYVNPQPPTEDAEPDFSTPFESMYLMNIMPEYVAQAMPWYQGGGPLDPRPATQSTSGVLNLFPGHNKQQQLKYHHLYDSQPSQPIKDTHHITEQSLGNHNFQNAQPLSYSQNYNTVKHGEEDKESSEEDEDKKYYKKKGRRGHMMRTMLRRLFFLDHFGSHGSRGNRRMDNDDSSGNRRRRGGGPMRRMLRRMLMLPTRREDEEVRGRSSSSSSRRRRPRWGANMRGMLRRLFFMGRNHDN